MNVRKCLLGMICIMGLTTVQAQTPAPNELPVLIPPSPELASLAKIGSLSTGLHTGSANVNIPLYEMSNAGIKLPIALSYSTNGIKVNDIASRVGMGWNLVAGGVISRVIHDEDDLAIDIQRPALPASLSPTNDNRDLYDYLLEANMDDKDTEKDEYSFSVNGMSGKFFFDDNGIPRQASHSNIKIEKVGDVFILTDPEGVKYYFGENGATEKTRGYLTNGTGRWDRISQTGWFLTKIMAQGRVIFSFTYTSLFIKTLRGPSQSMVVAPVQGGDGSGTGCSECEPICAGSFKYPNMNQVDYDTKKLETITSFFNGNEIYNQAYFVYESRGDIGGDHRLKNINIQQSVNMVAVDYKKYLFEYDDYAISGDWNKRFYLKKIFSLPCQSSPAGSAIADNTPLVHEFEYNDPAGLPSQKSYDQDYFGYANNTGSYNYYFAPKIANYALYPQGSLLANREPNYTYMQKGVLKKVIYPTGGYEMFNYEQHTIPEQLNDSVYVTSGTSGTGVTNPVVANTKLVNFTTGANGIIKATLSASQNPAGPFPGESGHWYPQDGHHLVEFKIKRASDNVAMTITDWLNIYDTAILNYTLVNLQPNTAYIGELRIFGQSTFGKIVLEHSPVVNTYWSNTPACGLRVNSIRSFDPVSNKESNKFYKYAAIDNINVSSGKGIRVPLFSKSHPSGGMCTNPCGNGHAVIQVECNNNVQISSSSLSELPEYGGSPVAYTDVIESDDAGFANGAVQHNFYTLPYPAGVVVTIFGSSMPGTSTGMQADMNGRELKTSFYKKYNNQLQLTKKVENTFSVDNRILFTSKNYVHRQRWAPWLYENSLITMVEKIKPFDMLEYTYKSTWIHLDNTTVTEYDPEGTNPIVSTTTYEYGNTAHTLPTRVTTTASNGDNILQDSKYPADYGYAPYTTMVAQNIVSPVIESKTTKAATLISTVTTDYADWFSNGSILKPSVVNMKKGNNANEPRLRFHHMDDKGNITEVSKENGTRVSYVWDYKKSMPVAEVKNAEAADIAFSSFETDDNTGNWTVLGTPLPGGSTDLNTYWTYYENDGLTGKRSYGGRLSKTVNAARSYVVTLWSKAAAAPTVNATAGTLLLTKNSWKLYKWTVSSVASITVQGNQVDEVRLHPSTALMTSYTYFPFVGTSSVADAANNIQYYEYDGLNRLLLVRDMDKNIVKQYDYKYNQAIAPCAVTAADWQPTGITRCVTDVNNAYTGVKEAQERDENNCSTGYLSTRWVTITTPPGECVTTPGCSGPDKRWVNGVCETGVRTFVSSYKQGNTWYCTYKYVWSDGYNSPTFEESGTAPCIMDIE